MIFISHTNKDKPLVEPIAQKLSQVFGKDKVFYDSRSIQPGDGIIDKMNKWLEQCDFFFFFVSKNSLQSDFVKLERQNAIYKATKNKIRLIPVKLDDCLMPDILLQTMYIDYFWQGSDNAIRQMIDVVKWESTYRPGQVQQFQNIRAYVKEEENTIIIEFRAEVYMEPHSKYLVLLDNEEKDIAYKAVWESVYSSKFNKDLAFDNGLKSNALYIGRDTATSPWFPFIVELSPKIDAKINLRGIMKATSRTQFASIPIIKEN